MRKWNSKNRSRLIKFRILPAILFFPFLVTAQQNNTDSLPQQATLANCVQYALKHQPFVQAALIDERITEETIKTKLADWYPQLNLDAGYQNNIKLPTSYFGGNYVSTGTHNISNINLSATQNIFNRDVLLASRTAHDVRTGIRQITDTVAATFTAVYIDTTIATLASSCVVVNRVVTVRPNPSIGSTVTLIIETSDAIQSMPILVYNMNGRLVQRLQESKGSGIKIIDLSVAKLAKGKYFINITNIPCGHYHTTISWIGFILPCCTQKHIAEQNLHILDTRWNDGNSTGNSVSASVRD